MNIYTYDEFMNLMEQNASPDSTDISPDQQALNKLNLSRMRRWNKKDLINRNKKVISICYKVNYCNNKKKVTVQQSENSSK